MISCESCANDTCGFAGTVDGYLTECSWYKPKNNADRIRAMTDEELAAWIADHPVVSEYDENIPLHKAWLDWLRQEAKDEGTADHH